MQKLTQSLQESVLTLICTSDIEGAIAANLVGSDYFEGAYEDIAIRAISYHNKFGKAPGTAHLDDLFDQVLSDPKNKKRRLYTQILEGIMDQAKGLNTKYVLSRANDFLRQQNLKAAVLDAAEQYERGGDDLVANVEKILRGALTFSPEPMDSGTFLNDRERAIAYLTTKKHVSYKLGIPELDRYDINPTVGKAFGFMAPAKRGKTWFCIEAGVKAMMANAKVVHISLEMSEEELLQRYHQRLFAIAKRNEAIETTIMEFDELNRLSAFAPKTIKPKLDFEDPDIGRKILKKMDQWGSKFGRLVVKQFPTSSLSIQGLEAYLDGLELAHGFIPNMLIVDYPRIMKLDRRQDRRVAIGMMHEELRGVAVKRNLALVEPIQGNRESESGKANATNIGEDYSIGQTVDFLVIYNQTVMEKDAGLARLLVNFVRSDKSDFQVIITQNYGMGQFCTASALMPSQSYWKRLKEYVGKSDDDKEEE